MVWEFPMFNFAPVAFSLHRNASAIAAISSGTVTRTVTSSAYATTAFCSASPRFYILCFPGYGRDLVDSVFGFFKFVLRSLYYRDSACHETRP